MASNNRGANRRPRLVWNVLRQPGMSPGNGRKVPDDWQPDDETQEFGQGTIEDPKVYWVYRPSRFKNMERVVRRCTEIAQQEARKLEMTVVWVRTLNHPYKSGYSHTTRVVLPSLSHITVALSNDISRVLWEGHIYTKDMADKSGAPQRILEESETNEPGGNPQLWASGPYPYSQLPEDYQYTFSLTPGGVPVSKRPAPLFYTEPQQEKQQE
ncbi:hypothetical protein K449DRAFT_440376 [Hypoxylon sp. EC38]|nr:hypothetical protein K449DRAFT_440376 [Hypoxylon sp. EC38]